MVVMVKELEVTIRVANNRLRERRTKLGYTQHEMSLAIGIPHQVYGSYECMSKSPLKADGQWSPSALKIADYFDCDVEEIFPPSVLKIESPVATRKLDGTELRMLMSAHSQSSAGGYEQNLLEANEEETSRYLTNKAVARLKPAEAEVIRARFGMEGVAEETCNQLADKRGVSKGRVHQIVKKAMRKLSNELYESTAGKDRFVLYFLDTFESEDLLRFSNKLQVALAQRFPGVAFWSRPRTWMPTPIEVRACGFLDEGIVEVQAQVDKIAREIFNAEPLRERKIPPKVEPAPKPKPIPREVIELSLSPGRSKNRIKTFVMEIIKTAVLSQEHKLVRARCDSRADGQLIADQLLDAAKKGFGFRTGHRSVFDWEVYRTRMELSNGSAIDLVCEEIERFKKGLNS